MFTFLCKGLGTKGVQLIEYRTHLSESLLNTRSQQQQENKEKAQREQDHTTKIVTLS